MYVHLWSTYGTTCVTYNNARQYFYTGVGFMSTLTASRVSGLCGSVGRVRRRLLAVRGVEAVDGGRRQPRAVRQVDAHLGRRAQRARSGRKHEAVVADLENTSWEQFRSKFACITIIISVEYNFKITNFRLFSAVKFNVLLQNF
jgi:hypothetical protein